jgi:hypothetical protein
MALASERGCVLILDFHNYVQPLDSDTLLVWHQAGTSTGPTAPIVLRIFRLSDLPPLEGELEELCGSMRRAGAPFLSSAAAISERGIPTTIVGRTLPLDYPDQLRHLDEILILCHSSAIADSSAADRSNLALLVARPREGTYELFPQDWFNNAGLDYGYQWVTRVTRDPRTGRIHGEGIRIDPFVLDNTLRHRR